MVFFFFIGGVQPRVVSKPAPGPCPKCGSNQVEERRVDHVFTLFFIPLFKVQRGQPFLVCRNCGWDSRMGDYGWSPSPAAGPVLQPSTAHGPEATKAAGVEGVEQRQQQQPSAPQAELRCPHCGNPVDPSFLFCPFCGTYLRRD